MILPEYGVHIFINVLFLIGAQWSTLLINMPLIVYHLNKFRTRRVIGGFGIYDPTTIMNAQTLRLAQREGWIKLGFYIVTFCYYIYCMIAELIRQ
jgi:protein cornichon